MKTDEKKVATNMLLGFIAIAVIAVGALYVGGYLGEPQGLTAYPGQPAPPAPGQPVPYYPPVVDEGCVCELSSKSIVTVKEVNRHKPTTAISSGLNMHRELGSSWTNVATGSTIEKHGCILFDFVGGIDTTDESAREYCPYYPMMEMPCTYGENFVVMCADDAVVGDLVGNYFSRFDTAGATEAITAGNEPLLGFIFIGSSDEDYGNAYCGGNPSVIDDTLTNIVVFQYNLTTVDGVELKNLNGDTGMVKVAPIPTGVQNTLLTDFSALKGFKAYYFPVLQDDMSVKGQYVLDTDDTTEPATDDLKITLWDSSWYFDADDGLIKYGVEDEDQTNIGAASYDVIAPVFS